MSLASVRRITTTMALFIAEWCGTERQLSAEVSAAPKIATLKSDRLRTVSVEQTRPIVRCQLEAALFGLAFASFKARHTDRLLFLRPVIIFVHGRRPVALLLDDLAGTLREFFPRAPRPAVSPETTA